MTVKNIQDLLKQRYSNSEYLLRNSYIFNYDWESDFFCMSQSCFYYEGEIKMSRQDYFNDFKKYKHKLLYDTHKAQEITEKKIPHRFFFVVPEGLIKPNEVPDYAGLIYAVDRGTVESMYLRFVKPSPFIHKNKFNLDKVLLKKYYTKVADLNMKLYDAEIYIKNLKQDLNDRDNTIQRQDISKTAIDGIRS